MPQILTPRFIALLATVVAVTGHAEDRRAPDASQGPAAKSGPAIDLLQPFEARYKIWMNGDHLGKASMSLGRNEQGQFEVKLNSRATEGMAGFVGAKTVEFSRFGINGGRAVSNLYTQRKKVFLGGSRWRAEFDWQDDAVKVKADREWSQPLDGEELDPLNIYLYLAHAAAENRRVFEVDIVDDEGMRHFSYRALPNETLETACGTFETRVFERTLSESAKHAVTWHARELAWLPIRVQKTKADGDVIRLELLELTPADGATLSMCPTGSGASTASASAPDGASGSG